MVYFYIIKKLKFQNTDFDNNNNCSFHSKGKISRYNEYDQWRRICDIFMSHGPTKFWGGW